MPAFYRQGDVDQNGAALNGFAELEKAQRLGDAVKPMAVHSPAHLVQTPQGLAVCSGFVPRRLILQAMKPAWRRYLLHSILWVFLYFFPPLLSLPDNPGLDTLLAETNNTVHLISFLLLIGFSYVNYFWLVPRFYLGRHYLLYAALLVFCLAVVIKLPQLIDPINGNPPGGFDGPPGHDDGPPGDGPLHAGPSILSGMTYTIILFFLSTFLAITVQHRLLLFRIEKEKLNAELSFLKAQINPHFLFNTLNSIYSLALIKSDETPTAITQLAELMRYIMRDAKENSVDLEKEVAYIRNYTALQKKRLGHTVSVLFEVTGKTAGYRIAPLLLMSFIENAFKHGVNPDRDSRIEVKLTVEDNVLRLFVFNHKTGQTQKEEWGGIGLQNTKDRLQHLYPDRHELRILDDATTFTVNLTLNLA